MKKILIYFAAALVIFTGGCGKKEPEQIPAAMPGDIISEEDAEKAIGNEYDLVLNEDSVYKVDKGIYRAEYLPNPLGKNDPVLIEIVQPGNDSEAVKEMYDKGYESRTQKRRIEGIGDSAYVSFPTIHIYEKGYLIEITAGSGDTQGQLDLLTKLGKKAVKNLDAYYAQYEEE